MQCLRKIILSEVYVLMNKDLKEIIIRVASEEDAEALLNIYTYYVKNTAITFEHEVPTLEEFKNRIRETLKNYPYLVAVVDGKIAGYIYASRFRTRASYAWSASTSIYLDKQYHRLGIGKMLYEKLENILVKQNVINVYAGAADPVEKDEYLTRNSEHFHEAIGYKTVARYHECGSKFGRWYNLLEMEKIIGKRTYPPKEFIPFDKLQE